MGGRRFPISESVYVRPFPMVDAGHWQVSTTAQNPTAAVPSLVVVGHWTEEQKARVLAK